ncbi:DUF1642 domain-containing protein [Listeria seeligeri]|uniref:DUF1642 domain-containing protein n=1 Tax=Listeria seeligeri TaxID=1640 RepID=UPI0022EB38A1|nr:DUF1642 domain-containing protein [Listeria seeligeri]
MKFKKGDLVEVIWRSELYRGAVTQVVEVTNEIVVKLAKKPAIDYLFEQNQVSKVELVKVPQFVADVIRILKGKWGDDLATSIDYKLYTEQFVHKWSFDERIRGWLQYASNQETFARAWMDGYEIEQEPLFIMPVPYSVLPVHYYINRLDEISFKQGNAQKFTWNEIEKYFPEITKYAVKVEGVAE